LFEKVKAALQFHYLSKPTWLDKHTSLALYIPTSFAQSYHEYSANRTVDSTYNIFKLINFVTLFKVVQSSNQQQKVAPTMEQA
jgi:hypothetical protein